MRAVAAALALALLAAAGCGGEGEQGSEAVAAVGDVKVDSVASLAQCRDWNAGSEDAKAATIADIREQINLEDGPVRTPALDDEQAHEVFENACEPAYAQGFRLYVLYARAAGFAALLEE